MHKNILEVGLPKWSEEDQKLAKAVQKEVDSEITTGLSTELLKLGKPRKEPKSGGSDDIGEVSWKVPSYFKISF